MRLRKSIIYKSLGAILLLVVLGLVICGAWLYTGRLNQAKIKFFTKFYLPYAMVNSSPISMSKFVFRYNLAQNIQPTDIGQTVTQVGRELIKEEEIRQLASRNAVLVSQKQIDEEYNYQAGQSDLSKQAAFESLLSGHSLKIDQFKNEVLKPQLFNTNMKIWFNAQNKLNPVPYRQANDLLNQISNGQDMGLMAATYSQDDLGKNTEGNLGFVQVTSLLPELREPIENMSIGQVKIIPDRNGIHIFRVEGKSNNRPHLREIYLKTTDFDQWLAAQLAGMKVYTFLKV